ncbi:acyltransferase family protein [Sphingomonas jaspsi]|uniref:acyltransferase family protein n=1 Tax=Sphingomonas jaspsi TaxID=392409 RepID=UPI000562AC4F|nr:acyltransferase [Sphingomonas jaspsi]
MVHGRLQSIQALRFIAASLVVVTHASHAFPLGNVGCDIFFVISGFIIASLLPKHTPTSFLRSRLTRIYPFWWAILLPKMVYQIVVNGKWDAARAFTSITLWPVMGDFTVPYLFVGWTLCFEMLFYVCASLVLVDRRAAPVLTLAYVVALAGALAVGTPLLAFVGNPIILEFLMGVLIARLPGARPAIGGGAVMGGIAAIVLFTTPQLSHPYGVFDVSQPLRAVLWGVPAAVLVWGALQLEPLFKGRAASALAYGGDASYSIYLVHMLVIAPLAAFIPWTLLAVLAIGVGLLVHRHLEKPLLSLVRSKARHGGKSVSHDRHRLA